MLFERFDDGFDHFPMSAIAAFHVNMRFLVGGSSLLRQSFEGRFGIAVAQLDASISARGALSEDIDGRIEPDGDCPLVEEPARARIDESPAAGGNDSNLVLDQSRHQPSLAVAEILFSETLKDFRGGIAGGALDFGVAIDKGHAQTAGEAPPHR